MRFAAAKNRLISVGAALTLIGVATSPAVFADTFPYLKAYGGDSWAGGAYISSSGTCDNAIGSSYQDPENTGLPQPGVSNGGILTYANSSGGGSTDEFAAFALGQIDGSGVLGDFFSNSNNTSLSFANTGPQDGGLFEDINKVQPKQHCIPDYYGKLRASSAAVWAGNYNAGPGQFKASGTTILSGGTVNAGSNLSLFVSGDVFITGNITYGGYNETNVPKFAIVAKGNIFIDSSVTQLDGVYVAQPTNPSSDGRIWTCYDTSVTSPVPNSNSAYGPWIHDNCNNKLTVNGSLIAQQVNFLRVNGDATSAPVNEPLAANNAAEVMNYTPAMVIGGPFFNPAPPSSSLKVDSLISLPPLF